MAPHLLDCRCTRGNEKGPRRASRAGEKAGRHRDRRGNQTRAEGRKEKTVPHGTPGDRCPQDTTGQVVKANWSPWSIPEGTANPARALTVPIRGIYTWPAGPLRGA